MTIASGDGGAIRGTVLAEAFARLGREGFSGALIVKRGEEISRAYFREGDLVGAMVYGRFKPLGITFLEAGAIDIEALNASLAIIASAHVPQGQVLVEMGAITEEQLQHGLRHQVIACASALLLLPDGEWSLETEVEYPDWTDGIRVRPGMAVLEAFRDPGAEPLLHRVLDPLGSSRLSLRVEAPQVVEHFELEPEEARALAHLDGRTDLPEVARTSGLTLPHVVALVASLAIFHLVAATGDDHELERLVPHHEAEPGRPAAPVVPEPVSLPTPNVGGRRAEATVIRAPELAPEPEAEPKPKPKIAAAKAKLEALAEAKARKARASRKARAAKADRARKAREAMAAARPAAPATDDGHTPIKPDVHPPPLPDGAVEGDPRERAEALFRQGMAFFEREHYQGALPFLRDAVHLDPTHGLWSAYFAWTLYLVGPPEVVVPQVRLMLELAAETEDGAERARYFLEQLPAGPGDDSLDAWS